MNWLDKLPQDVVPIRTILSLLLYTGMRPKTIFSISEKNFNISDFTITFIESKTYKPRTVKLNKAQFFECYNFFVRYGNVRSLYNSVKAIRRASKEYLSTLPKLQQALSSLYTLRYIYIAHLISDGWSVKRIQKHLNHTSEETTKEYIKKAEELLKLIKEGD